LVGRTDKSGMAHKTLAADLAAEVPAVVLMDRRRTPSRRTDWRGGRRDSDWKNRPEGALSRVFAGHFPWPAWLKRS